MILRLVGLGFSGYPSVLNPKVLTAVFLLFISQTMYGLGVLIKDRMPDGTIKKGLICMTNYSEFNSPQWRLVYSRTEFYSLSDVSVDFFTQFVSYTVNNSGLSISRHYAQIVVLPYCGCLICYSVPRIQWYGSGRNLKF